MKPRLSTRSRHRFLPLTLGLVLALLAVSCAPSAATETVPPPEPTASVESVPATEAAAPESEPTPGLPSIMVTPRGDSLEATDPATVSLASGGLQLVEFFRFT